MSERACRWRMPRIQGPHERMLYGVVSANMTQSNKTKDVQSWNIDVRLNTFRTDEALPGMGVAVGVAGRPGSNCDTMLSNDAILLYICHSRPCMETCTRHASGERRLRFDASPITRAWLRSSSSAGRRIQYLHDNCSLTMRTVWLLVWYRRSLMRMRPARVEKWIAPMTHAFEHPKNEET